MRGTAIFKDPRDNPRRITPAHAGNSIPPVTLRAQRKDHPRSCGEQVSDEYKEKVQEGSPPLMRGTVYRGSPGTGH